MTIASFPSENIPYNRQLCKHNVQLKPQFSTSLENLTHYTISTPQKCTYRVARFVSLVSSVSGPNERITQRLFTSSVLNKQQFHIFPPSLSREKEARVESHFSAHSTASVSQVSSGKAAIDIPAGRVAFTGCWKFPCRAVFRKTRGKSCSLTNLLFF